MAGDDAMMRLGRHIELGWRDAAAVVLASVFAVAGIDKALRFWEFLQVVAAYRIVPGRYVPLVGVLTIVAEFLCAFLILWRRTRLPGALLAGVLVAVFLEASAVARITGYTGECGCFSFYPHRVGSSGQVLQDLLLIGLAGVLVSTHPGVERRLLRASSSRKMLSFVLAALLLDGGLVTYLWHVRTREQPVGQGGAGPSGKRGGQLVITAEGLPTHRVLADTSFSAEQDPRLAFGRPSAIRFLGEGRLVVLDTHRRRIVLLDTSGKFIMAFGREGKGPGELMQPSALGVGPDGKIYVADPAAARVSVFTKEGRFVRSFPSEGAGESIAADSRGFIYTNEPARGKLIAVYDSTGEFVESFGELLLYERPAPPIPGAENVVVFDIDDQENLWLAFQLHPKPELRKYDRAHRLVFSARLDLPEVRRELETYRRRGEGFIYPIFAKDVCIDEGGQAWVLLMYESALYGFAPDGRLRVHIRPVDPRLENEWYLLDGIAVVGGCIWATDAYHREVVKFRIPTVR